MKEKAWGNYELFLITEKKEIFHRFNRFFKSTSHYRKNIQPLADLPYQNLFLHIVSLRCRRTL